MALSTQPCCGACWQAYSYGQWGEVRDAVRSRDAFIEREVCCFCAGDAEQGIYVRVDEDKVPFANVDIAWAEQVIRKIERE